MTLNTNTITISDGDVRFHIRGPRHYNSVVGQGSSITCSIDAPEADDTFVMFVDGTPFYNLSSNSTWYSAGFNKSSYDWGNGTISTDIEGFVDEFTADHNRTLINCTSYKYPGHISMRIRVRPDNSTDNNTGKYEMSSVKQVVHSWFLLNNSVNALI